MRNAAGGKCNAGSTHSTKGPAKLKDERKWEAEPAAKCRRHRGVWAWSGQGPARGNLQEGTAAPGCASRRAGCLIAPPPQAAKRKKEIERRLGRALLTADEYEAVSGRAGGGVGGCTRVGGGANGGTQVGFDVGSPRVHAGHPHAGQHWAD